MKMKITANGRDYQVATDTSLSAFLQELNLAPERVVVEKNKTALTPHEIPTTSLEDGDVLEIVRIVAGG